MLFTPEGPGALNGVLVLDLATSRAEMAGRVLADLGARVLKIEPPGGADARRLPPFAEEAGSRRSLYWEFVAAGKKSAILDLESAADRDRLRGVARRADILIESYDPGRMRAWGLDYDNVGPAAPSLIYVSITPFGQSGPDAACPATALTIDAASGVTSLQGDRDRPPLAVGFPQPEFHGAAQAAADALCALYERERSGRGQHLDVSMQAAMVGTLMASSGYVPNTGMEIQPASERRRLPPPELAPGIQMPRFAESADGYILLPFNLGPAGGNALAGARRWAVEEEAIDPDLRDLPLLNWALDVADGTLPVATLNRLLAQIVTFLGNKTSREVVSRSSVDRLMMAPGLSTADLREDPQLQARGFWRDDGAVTRPGPFAKLSRTPLTSASAPRQIGQDQALLDELLLPPDDVQAGGPGIVTGGSDSEPVRGDIFGELKVADFTWAAAGPILSRALADHGAMVVHVESEAHVDLARMLPPYKDGQPGVNRSHLAASFNASKFGLTTNFKTPEGLEVIRRLIDWADVVVDNYAPGVLEGAGLTYESLSADRPDLVMLSTTMRGATGPERSYAGYGAQGAALAGLHAITGWPDRFPVGPWGPLTDFIAPRFGLAALAAALRHRERTGEGQFIDLSQVECGIQFIGPLVLDYTVNGKVARARGQESDTACPHGIYATIGDERYVAVAVETPGQWRALVQLAPLADFSDAMFDSLERRITDRSRIEDRVREWCTDQEAGTVTATLRAAGIPASAVLRPGELHQDPQLLHRGFFITADHAVLGATPFDGFVTQFSETPPQIRRPGPCLGADTELVLHEFLGMGDGEIAALAAVGALT